MRLLLLLFILLTVQTVFSQDTLIIKQKSPFTAEFVQGSIISMIDLISNPKTYHGKRIQLIGFLNVEFEGTAIYLHKEDYDNSITKNGISLSFDKNMYEKIEDENLNQTYVIIAGTFNMNEKGHFGLWSGYIGKIYRLNKWD